MNKELNRAIAPNIASLAVPKLLDYEIIQLNNGIELVITNDPNQQVFKLDVVFEAGGYYQHKPLLASTTINMLNEGTTKYDAQQIAELFDYYGAYTDFNCGMSKSEISLISLNKYANKTVEMLYHMISDSTIPENEVEIFLRNKRQQFLVNAEKTGYIARKEFTKLLFGAHHPYADQVTADSYNSLSIDEIRTFYRQRISATGCRIVVSGNVDTNLKQIIISLFEQLPKAQETLIVPEHSFQPATVGEYRIEKEGAVQTSIRIGKQGVVITDDDYAQFQLLNTILGGYFGSRLMSNIREEKGYTYGINSFNVTMPLCGYWGIATDVNKQYADATIEECQKEIKRLQNELVSDEELQLVKNFLHGELLRELDGVFSQSDTLKHKLNYGLDNSIYEKIIHQVKECSAQEIRELANRHLDCNQMYYVIVG